MKLRSLFALCCLLLPVVSASADPVPDHLQLFLLIGQSNMAGRGTPEAPDLVTNPHIFMLTKDLQWTLAKDPLHFDKPNVAGVGPGSEFARTLAKANPTVNIGLIPCAVGGTSLDEWKVGGKLYTDAVARAQAAMKQGTLTGILWHQGEADSRPEKVATYATRFATMIGQLRTDLHAPGVPVVIGELGRFRANGGSEAFNAALPGVASHVPRCAYVTSEGLTDRGDHLHFNAGSARTLGQRYAAAYQKLAGSPGAMPAH